MRIWFDVAVEMVSGFVKYLKSIRKEYGFANLIISVKKLQLKWRLNLSLFKSVKFFKKITKVFLNTHNQRVC